jgi:hypothetical protein
MVVISTNEMRADQISKHSELCAGGMIKHRHAGRKYWLFRMARPDGLYRAVQFFMHFHLLRPSFFVISGGIHPNSRIRHISFFSRCPKSRNRVAIPIERSHNRNMFPLWCGFRHLKQNEAREGDSSFTRMIYTFTSFLLSPFFNPSCPSPHSNLDQERSVGWFGSQCMTQIINMSIFHLCPIIWPPHAYHKERTGTSVYLRGAVTHESLAAVFSFRRQATVFIDLVAGRARKTAGPS